MTIISANIASILPEVIHLVQASGAGYAPIPMVDTCTVEARDIVTDKVTAAVVLAGECHDVLVCPLAPQVGPLSEKGTL